MADHSTHGDASAINAHRDTYAGFIRGSVALVLLSLMICTALIMFRFAGACNVLMGFGGLAIGLLALLIDVRSGTTSWPLSAGWAVIFGLVTAVSVS